MNLHYLPKRAKYIAWNRINTMYWMNVMLSIKFILSLKCSNRFPPAQDLFNHTYCALLTKESLYFNQYWKINKNIMFSYFYDFLKLLFSLPTTFYSPNFTRKCALDMSWNSIHSPIPKSNFLYWIWINHSHHWSLLALNLKLTSERKLYPYKYQWLYLLKVQKLFQDKVYIVYFIWSGPNISHCLSKWNGVCFWP